MNFALRQNLRCQSNELSYVVSQLGLLEVNGLKWTGTKLVFLFCGGIEPHTTTSHSLQQSVLQRFMERN